MRLKDYLAVVDFGQWAPRLVNVELNSMYVDLYICIYSLQPLQPPAEASAYPLDTFSLLYLEILPDTSPHKHGCRAY
jgi:hypothetical protein